MNTFSAHFALQPSRGWHITLWIIQAVLTLVFGTAGFMKLFMPIDALAAQMIWPGEFPAGLVRFIGAVEIIGALGTMLPAITRIKPALTPLAAIGLATIMILAVVFHIIRGELYVLAPNILLTGLALILVWGRLRKAPILPK